MRHRLPLAFFLCSGACGLVYEVVWTRLFSLSLGAASYSIAAVLAAYMGGLALGSWLATRIPTRRLPPLSLYGLLELVTAAWALLLPTLLAAAEPVLRWAYRDGAASFATFVGVRLAFSVLLLLVPTTCMGATLPILCRHFLTDPARTGRAVGLLYALNALGAAAGAAGSGLLLLPLLGQARTTWIAAGVNAVIGVGALLLGRGTRTEAEPVMEPDPRPASALRKPLIVVFASGLAAMVYQVAWTRSFSLAIGSSTYAFCLIVTAFIAGISLGSWVLSHWTDTARDLGRLLGIAQILLAISALAVVPVHGRLPLLLAPAYLANGLSFAKLETIEFGALLALTLAPTFFMGATFPLAVRLHAGVAAGHGPRSAGIVYAWNTLGCIVGSLLGGFVALPVLGIQRSIAAASAVNAGGALAAGWSRSRPRCIAFALAAVAVGSAGFLLPSWDRSIMDSGAYVVLSVVKRARLTPQETGDLETLLRAPGTAVYYREGVSATVSVREIAPGERVLRINGKNDASTTGDMPNQVLLGHLPMLLCSAEHPDVLHIGLGGGVSLGALATHPVSRLECVEIAPEVWDAAEYFASPYTHDAIHDPRLVRVTADGRNHLALTSRRYDAIVSQPSNPWISGIGSLFTREFFVLCRARLAPHGIAVVWLQSYSLAVDDFRRVLSTFADVFPECSLWEAKPGADYLLVGTLDRFEVPAAQVTERMKRAGVKEELEGIHVRNLDDLAACYVMGPAEVAAWGRGAGENTDDNAALEWDAPRCLYAEATGWQVSEVNPRRSADYSRWTGLEAIGPRADVEKRFSEARKARAQASSGLAFVETGEIQKAQVAFEHAIAWNAQDAWACLGLARILDAAAESILREVNAGKGTEQDVEDAVRHLSRATELDRGNWQYWSDYGLALSEVDRLNEAAHALDEALTLSARAYPALVNAGMVQTRLRAYEKAVSFLKQALAIDTGKPDAWMFLGNVYCATKDFARAIDAYKEMIHCDPKEGLGYYLMGLTYMSMDPPQKARAQAYVRRAKELGYPPDSGRVPRRQ